MKNYDRNKTLEQLEKEYWSAHDYETPLIEKCHMYRRIKLKDLNIGEIRMLLGQNIGNKYMIPLAIEHLNKNILCEGNFFEGDLLLSVLKVDKTYWTNNPRMYSQMIDLISKNSNTIDSFETVKFIKDELLETVKYFKGLLPNECKQNR